MNGKKLIPAVLALIGFSLNGFCQEAPLSITELDVEAAKTASSIREFLKTSGGGSIRGDGSSTGLPFGVYWTETILTFLSSGIGNQGITVLHGASGRPDYTLQCSVLELGSTVRVYTRLIKRDGAEVASVWTTDFPRARIISLLTGSPGQWDAFEPDSAEQPVFLEPGGAEMYRSLYAGDEDWFEINCEEDGFLVVETSGETDTMLTLYDASRGPGSLREITSNDDTFDINARVGIVAKRGSRYIVRANGYSESETGSYGIRAHFSDAPDKDMEPNDTMNTAFPISTETSVTGYILSEDEEDWYRLVLKNGRFDAGTEGDIDTYLELFDQNGRMLTSDDDSGDYNNAVISLPVAAGTYYLKVTAYEPGEYTLRCELREPNQADAYEPDDDPGDAKSISIGEEQIRSFTTEDDMDWVRFTVNSRGTYTIRAWGQEYSDLDTVLNLYNGAGDLIVENDDYGDSYSSRINRTLSPGSYLIRVHVLEYPRGSYRLSVTQD
ncbi:MAG: DVUA0089 family protein [Treponema sp.]|jgi:hypothetical protein|nr:DVUA0089 family protein [Treponema sp.]